ncbi:hypothetical protein ACFY1L_06945 [Streptomyces sp. NPDC001663]|uniref:hypothetical protein n=1 Tax=Streptomyces sp. NPDC001663 TaxID=3364597 RepID=UPI00367A049B
MTKPDLHTTPDVPDAPEEPTWPERTPLGAAWRGAVALAFNLAGIPAGAWLATKLAAYEPRLGGGPPVALALIMVVLLAGWLRARDLFLVATAWSNLIGTFGCCYLLGKGYISLTTPYLVNTTWAIVNASLLAIGSTAAVVTVVWGTVSGYRRPRPFTPKGDT